jgi:6-phosphogluconate dehydrogenase
MQIGMLGLGRMGGNMTERLLRAGHSVVVYNRSQPPIDEAVKKGAIAADSLAGIVRTLKGRKAVWVMVPAGDAVEGAIRELASLLKPGDIVIDGGNSHYKDSIRRGEFLKDQGIYFLDSGTSGGIWGLTVGYCLMIGGEDDPFAFMEPIFKSLAPESGFLHTGPIGSGHYVKMVHNGIEYAMLQAYAEGFEVLKESQYDLDLKAISELWQNGSVVRSWLLELTTDALTRDPCLEHVKAWVDDSGEGRWTVHEAIDRSVPAYTLASSLFARFASRHDDGFGLRLIAALRNEFGGHAIKKD